jgi:hypothetical protein
MIREGKREIVASEWRLQHVEQIHNVCFRRGTVSFTLHLLLLDFWSVSIILCSKQNKTTFRKLICSCLKVKGWPARFEGRIWVWVVGSKPLRLKARTDPVSKSQKVHNLCCSSGTADTRQWLELRLTAGPVEHRFLSWCNIVVVSWRDEATYEMET